MVLLKILFINILNSHSILLKSVCIHTFDFTFSSLIQGKRLFASINVMLGKFGVEFDGMLYSGSYKNCTDFRS